MRLQSSCQSCLLEDQFPISLMWTLAGGLSSTELLTTWQLATPRASNVRDRETETTPPQDRNCSVSYNQTLYMAHLTSAIFQCSQRPTLAPRGGGLTESEQQEVGPLGHLREATTAAHTPLPPHYSSLKSENSSRGRSVTQT